MLENVWESIKLGCSSNFRERINFEAELFSFWNLFHVAIGSRTGVFVHNQRFYDYFCFLCSKSGNKIDYINKTFEARTNWLFNIFVNHRAVIYVTKVCSCFRLFNSLSRKVSGVAKTRHAQCGKCLWRKL